MILGVTMLRSIQSCTIWELLLQPITRKQKCLGLKTVEEVIAKVNDDATKIKWDKNLYKSALKGIEYTFDKEKVRLALYRPYFKQWLYYDKAFNWTQSQLPKLLPTPDIKNRLICISGIGGTKDFTATITDCIPDFQFQFNSQCFPLYWYEENKIHRLHFSMMQKPIVTFVATASPTGF